MLLRLAAAAGRPGGRRRRGRPGAGRRRRPPPRPAGTCAEALTARAGRARASIPESVVDDDGATIAFTHCPFRELAEANPDLVCSLHRGLVEGFVDARGDGAVVAFHDLADRTPCQVEIAQPPR